MRLLYDWQSLLAGALGFAAAIIAVVLTLLAERRKARRELVAIRRSLGVELRQFVTMAHGAHLGFRKLAEGNPPITARMIENMVYIGHPVIYPASADKIGLLGSQAMQVVIFFNQIELARSGTEKLIRHRTPDNVTPALVAKMADVTLQICIFAQGLLPKLKTSVPETDNRDALMSVMISDAVSSWGLVRKKWPELDA